VLKPILYLFRGETVWMLSTKGIPEEDDLRRGGGADGVVATTVPRNVEVESALRLVQAEHPGQEVRIMNWHRPKRDV
jgi:hypothetical protein